MAAKLKDVTKMSQRERAEELVDLRRKHADVFDRTEELKSALKDDATASFKETFVGKGEVAVSPAHAKTQTGTSPELVVDQFLALPKKDQNALIKAGTVQIVDVYSGAFYGKVTVKVF